MKCIKFTAAFAEEQILLFTVNSQTYPEHWTNVYTAQRRRRRFLNSGLYRI
jgi:hypothetical protein